MFKLYEPSGTVSATAGVGTSGQSAVVHPAAAGDTGVGGSTLVGVATAKVTKVKRARVAKDFIFG